MSLMLLRLTISLLVFINPVAEPLPRTTSVRVVPAPVPLMRTRLPRTVTTEPLACSQLFTSRWLKKSAVCVTPKLRVRGWAKDLPTEDIAFILVHQIFIFNGLVFLAEF